MASGNNGVRISRGSEGGQSVAASTTSAASTNAVGATQAVIHTTVDCFVLAGTAPVATVADGTPLAANTAMRFVGLQATDKIAVITATGTGTIYIRPDA